MSSKYSSNDRWVVDQPDCYLIRVWKNLTMADLLLSEVSMDPSVDIVMRGINSDNPLCAVIILRWDKEHWIVLNVE